MKAKRMTALALVVALSIVFIFPPAEAYAASKTKKMTAYQCIKSGNTVFCSGLNKIYKVNLKTKEVTELDVPYTYSIYMKRKGNYLYCCGNNQSQDSGIIFRINLKTNKYKILAKKVHQKTNSTGFVISKSKIFYTTISWNKDGGEKHTDRVMKLNGKSKKKTKMKSLMTAKATNNKKYKLLTSEYSGDDAITYYFDYYLKTPSGKIHLGTEKLVY